MQASKGLGWRAPPRSNKATEVLLKAPTRSQLDAAARLSQGLSTSQLENKTSIRKKYGGVNSNINSFVLDPYGGSNGTNYSQREVLPLNSVNIAPMDGFGAAGSWDYDQAQNYQIPSAWLNNNINNNSNNNNINNSNGIINPNRYAFL